MSNTYELTVENRTTTGKENKRLRKQGLLPGVIYGFNVDAPTPVQVDARTFERLYHRAGNVHLVDVRVGEAGPATRVFISAVKRDPITHALAHVDFRAVNLRQEITAHVPITLTGDAPAVADGLGMLLQSLETLTVKVLPTAVPEAVTADVSGLTEVGSSVHVSDVQLPEGVTLVSDPEDVVARITAIAVEPEPEVEAPAEGAEAEGAEGADAEAGEGATDTDEDAS
ncbi:MAG TPA: 50S ribosomal protein L25 [Chloroflexia bacterium]|nr:50S ribosomal protein L25 [Chloroflexia bacterium]